MSGAFGLTGRGAVTDGFAHAVMALLDHALHPLTLYPPEAVEEPLLIFEYVRPIRI